MADIPLEAPAKAKRADPILMGRLFESVDTWDKVLPAAAYAKIMQATEGTDDPRADRMRFAEAAFYADAYQRPVEEVANAVEHFRDDWAGQVLSKDAVGADDATAFANIGGFLKTQNDTAKMLQDQVPALIDAWGRGEDFETAFSKIRQDWGMEEVFDYNKLDLYETFHRERWNDIAQQGEQLAPALEVVGAYFAQEKGRIPGLDPSGAEQSKAARQAAIAALAGLTPDQQDFVLSTTAAKAAATEGGQEGAAGKVAQTIGRGIVMPLREAGRGLMSLSQRDGGMFGPDEWVRADDAGRRLDQYLMGKADPVRSANWAFNGFLQAANQLPRIAATLHPAGMAANASAYLSEVRGDMLNRGMTSEQAFTWAPLAAAPYAALDFLSARMVFKGAVPGFDKAMRAASASTLGLARNAVMRLTLGTAEQYGQEVLQDLTTPSVQVLAGVLDQAVPEVKWAEEFASIGEAAPETLATLMWMGVVGTGAGTFKDRAYAKAMTQQRTGLLAFGFTPATVERIMAAESPADAELIMRLEYANRETGTGVQRDALAALDGETILPVGYRVDKMDTGYAAYDRSNQPIGVASTPEQAANLALQHQARASLNAEESFNAFDQVFFEDNLRQSALGGVLLRRQLASEQAVSEDVQGTIEEQAVVRQQREARAASQRLEQEVGAAVETQRTIAQQRAQKAQRVADFTPARLEDWVGQLREALAANQAGGSQETVEFSPETSPEEIQLLKLDLEGQTATKERERLTRPKRQAEARAKAKELVGAMVDAVNLVVPKREEIPTPEATFPISPRRPDVSDAELRRALPVPAGMTAAEVGKKYRRLRAISREVERLEKRRAQLSSRSWKERLSLRATINKLLLERLELQAGLGDVDAQEAIARYESERTMVEDEGAPRWVAVLDWIRKHRLPTLASLRKKKDPLAEDLAALELPSWMYSSGQTGGLDQIAAELANDLASEDGDLEARQMMETSQAGDGRYLIELVGAAWFQKKAGADPKGDVDVPVIGVLDKLEQWAEDTIAASQTRLLSGDPITFAALTVKGAFIIGRGVRDFAAWSALMVKEVGQNVAESLDVVYEAAKEWAARNATVESLGKRYTVMEGVGTPVEHFQVRLPGDMGRGRTLTAEQMQAEGVSQQVAPVVFRGVQEGLPVEMMPMIQARLEAQGLSLEDAMEQAQALTQPQELFDLTEDVQGFPKGSTMTRTTLQRMGMVMPALQAEAARGKSIEAWADGVIERRYSSGALNSLDPELLAAFAVKGAAIIGRGVRDFAAWSTQMVAKYGEGLRPHLESIYRESLALVGPRVAEAPAGGTDKLLDVVTPTPETVFAADEPAPEATLEKLVSSIKAAKPLQRETEMLYHQERKRRAARAYGVLERRRGESALRPMLSAMAGELPRMDFEPIRGEFTREETEALFQHILTHHTLENMVFTKASLSAALQAMLDYGRIPTRGELAQFEMIFGPSFVEALLDKRSKARKALDLLLEVLNLPRQLVATFDLSASLRQGFTLAVSHPKVAGRAFVNQLRAFMDTDYAHAMDRAFHAGPQAEVRDDAGLYVPHVDGAAAAIVEREERFQSRLLGKLADIQSASPIIKTVFAPLRGLGWVAKGSERAYTTYLNKLRVEVFDAVDREMVAARLDEAALANERKKLAFLINAATGRGTIKGQGTWQSVVNGLFFSPRFMVSRFEAPIRQVVAGAQGGRVGREALRQMVAQVATWTALFTLCLLAFDDDEVEFGVDPRSTDFLKVKIGGKTTIDTGAGYAQAWRLIARIATNTTVSTEGKASKIQLGGEIWRFFRYKLNPPASLAVSLRDDRMPDGTKPTAANVAASLTVPISLQTLSDVINEHGATGLLLTVPDVLGLGVNIYNEPEAGSKKAGGKPPASGDVENL